MNHQLLKEQVQMFYAMPIPAISRLESILCLLFESSYKINWAGLYLYDPKSQSCFLGPFFGKPACVEILKSKGVIGAAIDQNRNLNVPDVHAFPGHIACDAASRSECVILLKNEDRLLGVLDVDALCKNFFSPEIQDVLESVSKDIESLAGCITL